MLAVATLPLLTHLAPKRDDWNIAAPWSYTGPLVYVEQPFRVNQDNLRRIDVWAYVEGGAGATGEIFARLTPDGSDRPIRESRATVRGARFSNATVAFHFEPIPESRDMRYTLAVGVLSGPTPYVYLGLANGEPIPEGEVTISGEATPFASDLAMRTVGSGRFIEWLFSENPAHWQRIAEAILVFFVWLFLVVTTWAGYPEIGRTSGGALWRPRSSPAPCS